jgi:RimJ/RimL family protein N-acetyltransferase
MAESDGPLLFELDSDPEVMRWLSGGPGTPLELIEAKILPRFLADSTRAPWAGAWIATERESAGFAGWFSLRPDVSSGAELGYRLRANMWGRGLATEGAAALLGRAFAGESLRRVFATTYEFNTGSRRVLEKLGMRHERSFRLSSGQLASATTFASSSDDLWPGDEVQYGISREDWLARPR